MEVQAGIVEQAIELEDVEELQGNLPVSIAKTGSKVEGTVAREARLEDGTVARRLHVESEGGYFFLQTISIENLKLNVGDRIRGEVFCYINFKVDGVFDGTFQPGTIVILERAE